MSQTLARKNQTVHKNTNHYFKRILHQLWNPLNFSEPQLAGEQGGQLPPPPPWTCWARHIKSVNGFVFFRLSYFGYSDLQLFAIFIFEVDFSETYYMTNAEKSVTEPPNLKIFLGRIPPAPPPPLPPYKVRAFGTWDNAPSTVTKNLATALLLPRHKTLTNLFPMRIEPSSTGKILPTLSTRPILECKVTDSQ